MDFYKKIVKTKDVNSVLSDKECKCASLQAITNEAIKENNKKTLRELVEEINSHLTDLRTIKDDRELRNKDKCVELIRKFEECLVKIVNTTSQDILEPINSQLLVIQNLTNAAIANNDYEELKRLSERIERNIMIVNEIPEVKGARNSTNGDEKILALANKYTSLLNQVLRHLAQQKCVSEPRHNANANENIVQEKKPEPKKVPITDSNKIGISEIEEKLKQMRQRRLNRLSTFVDEQTILSKERRKENVRQDFAIQNTITETNTEQRRISEAVPVPDVIKPSLYKAAVRDNHENGAKDKMKKPEQMEIVEFSERNTVLQNKNSPQPSLLSRQTTFDNNKTTIKNTFSSKKADLPESTKDMANVFRSSFGKSGLTRSFAERQIENARLQKEKVQSSNSTTTTPPRTPTQIRKIFSSFNCALGTNNKSTEDLPREFYSPIETEFRRAEPKKREGGNDLHLFRNNSDVKKTEKLRDLEPHNVQVNYAVTEKSSVDPNRKENQIVLKPRLTGFKVESVGLRTTAKATPESNEPTPIVPPRNGKPMHLRKEIVPSRHENQSSDSDDLKVESVELGNTVNSTAQYNADSKPNKRKSVIEESCTRPVLPKELPNFPWRSSTDNDSVVIRPDDSDITDQESSEFITIKRRSSTTDQAVQRCSFSTFRTSSESIKDDNSMAVENPIYEILDHPKTLRRQSSRQNSAIVDTMLISAAGKEPSDFNFNTLDFLIRKRNRKMSYRNDIATDNASRIEALEPDIRKLEFIINIYRGLKRDDDYMVLDKALTKYYLKVNEVTTETSYDTFGKQKLLTRLKKAHDDLNQRVVKNEDILMSILTEQVIMIAEKYKIL